MTTINIAFDPGSSLTKIVYAVDPHEPKLLTMGSEVIALEAATLERYHDRQSSIGQASGTNDAYLKFRKRDKTVFAIGHLAQQFQASADLAHLKCDRAVPKLLAAIGAIVERENCNTEQSINIRLIALLPYGEYASRADFTEQLQKLGKRYYFRNERKLSLSFKNITVFPEGGGFLLRLSERKSQTWLESREAMCVLMIGHRNASFLTFSRGIFDPNRSHTSDWGFIQLVDRAIESSAGQNRERLTRSIYQLGNNIDPNSRTLRSLTLSQRADSKEREAQRLAEAIESARSEYWQRLRDWFKRVVPRELDELTIAGGGAYYLRHELSEYFGWANPYWQTTDANDPLIAEYPDPSLQHRICDIKAAYTTSFKPKASAKNSESAA
jgi:hypothetical protein